MYRPVSGTDSAVPSRKTVLLGAGALVLIVLAVVLFTGGGGPLPTIERGDGSQFPLRGSLADDQGAIDDAIDAWKDGRGVNEDNNVARVSKADVHVLYAGEIADRSVVVIEQSDRVINIFRPSDGDWSVGDATTGFDPTDGSPIDLTTSCCCRRETDVAPTPTRLLAAAHVRRPRRRRLRAQTRLRRPDRHGGRAREPVRRRRRAVPDRCREPRPDRGGVTTSRAAAGDSRGPHRRGREATPGGRRPLRRRAVDREAARREPGRDRRARQPGAARTGRRG